MEKRKERGKSAIIIAVIASGILVPLLLLIGIYGTVTFAVSNVFKESREEELFARFEQEGGIQWIYDEVETRLGNMKQELQMPEGMEPFKDIVTYEDVSSVSHGIYSAFLSGSLYVFDLSVQKERIRENVDAYFDKYIEEQNLGELMDSESIDIGLVRESYLKDTYVQLEERVLQLEAELNDMLKEIYGIAQIDGQEELRETYDLHGIRLSMLVNNIRNRVFSVIRTIVIFVFLLFVCHQFHPSGFFVAGGTVFVSGIMAFVMSRAIFQISVPEVVPAAFLFHESVYAIVGQIVSWISDGCLRFGIYSAVAGMLILLFGGILLLLQRKRA